MSAPLQQGVARNPAFQHLRVPGAAIEAVVDAALTRIISQEPDPLRLLIRVQVYDDRLQLDIKATPRALSGRLDPGEQLSKHPELSGIHQLDMPVALSRMSSRASIAGGASNRSRRDPGMIAALRRAHAIVARNDEGPVLTAAPTSQYGRRLVGLALLAPDIQRDILAGRQPRLLTLATLMAEELPINWAEQRSRFGFANSAGSAI